MSENTLPAVTEPSMPSHAETQAARKALLYDAMSYFAARGEAPAADDPKLDELLVALDSVDPLRAAARQEFGYLSYTCVINCGTDREAAERGFFANQTYFCQDSSAEESALHLRTRYITEWQPVLAP
ncbi:hypothetical protein JT358_13755 [Micrococcales bacterium 31B]|nr:hypothetical protein [Micrococcales bacterium 31B]